MRISFTRWEKRLAVITAIIFIFSLVFTLNLIPKKSDIILNWALETLDTVRQPGEDLLELRASYKDYSDKELIEKIHQQHVEKDPPIKVKFDRIDERYINRLAKLPAEQHKLAFTVFWMFLCLMISIYIAGSSIRWARGFKTVRSIDRGVAKLRLMVRS